MIILKKYIGLVFVLLLSYFAITPFFASGFFTMHDDTQVARVFAMQKSLADGMFPVRWVADLGYGYGYPIFNFYAPLAYYVGGFFALIGFDALIATKLMMVLGILLAGVGMYLFARQFWGEIGGAIAGLLYLYAPFHAVDIYVRGDVTEFWAYGFIPFVFWGLYKIYCHCEDPAPQETKQSRQKIAALLSSLAMTQKVWLWVSFTTVAYAALITSHNLTAFMVTPFIFAFAVMLFVISKKQYPWRTSLLPFAALFLGIILAAFYWLPTLTEMQYTNVLSQIGETANYKDHFVCPMQLWNSPWLYGGSNAGCTDGMSLKLGKIHIVLSLLAFVSLFVLWKKKRDTFLFAAFATTGLLFCILLTLEVSHPLWDAIHFMAFFQFPWRFLIMASFFSAFLGGIVGWLLTYFLREKNRFIPWILGISVMGAIVFFNADVFIPQTYVSKSANDYTNRDALHWEASKLTDEYLPEEFARPKKQSEVPTQKIQQKDSFTVISLTEKTQVIRAELQAKTKTDIIFNQAYFPAWQVFVDGKKQPYRFFEKGIIVTIPAGKHVVELRYVSTLVELIANMVTLTGVLVIIIGIISQRKNFRHA